jgi:hypothetical protein
MLRKQVCEMLAIAWNRESNGHWHDLDREVLGCSALILMATGLPSSESITTKFISLLQNSTPTIFPGFDKERSRNVNAWYFVDHYYLTISVVPIAAEKLAER